MQRRRAALENKVIVAKTGYVQSSVEIIASQSADGTPASGPKSFKAVAYSGGRVPGFSARPALPYDYVIDMAGAKVPRKLLAKLGHDNDHHVGHVTEATNDGKQLVVEGLLSAANEYSSRVENGAANGFPWEVSIEANLSRPVLLPSGKTQTINGQVMTGPLYVIPKSTFTGLAFVGQGADEGNQLTIAASADGEKKMDEFDKYIASCGLDPETITAEHRAQLQVGWDAIQASKKPSPPAPKKGRQTFKEIADEERQENARIEAIAKMGRDAMREFPMFIDQIEASVEHAIEARMSVDGFELQLHRDTRGVPGTRGFSAIRNGRPQNDPQVIEAALCMATNVPYADVPLESGRDSNGRGGFFSQATLEAVDRTGMRNASLQQILMQVANQNGYGCRAGERITTGNLRSVLEYCFPTQVMARMSGFSTVSMPNILGAVANKHILAGYMEEDATWREIASVKSVSNFHAQNHYRMLDSLEYEPVGSGGEIPHGTLGEETYTSQAATYGKMLGITRTQIINDDLGAFDDVRARLGRGAAKKFNNVFWAAFMNNGSFFTSALTNYISGATTNLGLNAVGLELGIKAYRTMTTPSADGTKRVGVNLSRPTLLLVPPELEFIAQRTYVSSNVNVGGGSSDYNNPDANIHVNKYRPVVQNRLSDSAFTGYSATAWYLFGSDLKPMLVTFLNGNQTPIVESTDADFNTLGIQFRGYHDFGCDKSEYLAGIKSKGAA